MVSDAAGRRLGVDDRRKVDGQQVYIEGRKIDTGAIVLVQKRSDALAVGQRAVRWMLLALAIAVALAIALALFVAWRLARPLRRTAAAAHALAAGRRDVIVYPEGPEEVAEVADALNALAAGPDPVRGARARVPAVGLARPAHPADRDQRLRRVARRRHDRARAHPGGRRRDAGRVAAAEPAGRRPARPGPARRAGVPHRPHRRRPRRVRPRDRAGVGRALRGGRGAVLPRLPGRRRSSCAPTRPGCGRRWTGCSTTRCG